MFRKILLTLLFFVVSPLETLAQSPGHLRQKFESKYVVVKINMPATKDGVDLRADRLPRIDQRKYRNKLRRAGTSVEQGEAIKLTFIKVKKKHIEVHLGAGGYGSQYVRKVVYPAAPMTEQEVNLEAELATVGEEYPEVKKAAQERLEGLRAERAKEDEIINQKAAKETAAKREAVRKRALAAGSRFNLRFKRRVPSHVLTTEGFEAALAESIEFSPQAVAAARKRQEAEKEEYERETQYANGESDESTPPADAQAVAGLKKGLMVDDVVELLGKPRNPEEWNEGRLLVKGYTFRSTLGSVRTEFIEDVLVRYTLSSQ